MPIASQLEMATGVMYVRMYVCRIAHIQYIHIHAYVHAHVCTYVRTCRQACVNCALFCGEWPHGYS